MTSRGCTQQKWDHWIPDATIDFYGQNNSENLCHTIQLSPLIVVTFVT